MTTEKKTALLSTILLALLITRNCPATPTEILPESSYYQGRSYFATNTADGPLAGRVDFAVYDTTTYPGEFVGEGGLTNPGQGRYVYAYQVFSDAALSQAALEYFAILGIGEQAIAQAGDIGSQDDSSGGIQPATEYFNPSFSRAVWEFQNVSITAGEHSYFLVLSSNHDYTAGSFRVIKQADDELPTPAPEPTTIALLGLGGAFAFAGRKKYA